MIACEIAFRHRASLAEEAYKETQVSVQQPPLTET